MFFSVEEVTFDFGQQLGERADFPEKMAKKDKARNMGLRRVAYARAQPAAFSSFHCYRDQIGGIWNARNGVISTM